VGEAASAGAAGDKIACMDFSARGPIEVGISYGTGRKPGVARQQVPGWQTLFDSSSPFREEIVFVSPSQKGGGKKMRQHISSFPDGRWKRLAMSADI
jgi:hypothetical protein